MILKNAKDRLKLCKDKDKDKDKDEENELRIRYVECPAPGGVDDRGRREVP